MTHEEGRFLVRSFFSAARMADIGPEYCSSLDCLKKAVTAGVRFGAAGLGLTGGDTSKLLAAARAGDSGAHYALRLISRDLTSRGEHLPLPLQEYIVNEAPEFKGEARRPANSDWERDAAIAAAVTILCKMHGFKRTRKRPFRKKESASSIVASVLGEFRINKTETAVEKIWEKYAKLCLDVGGVGRPRYVPRADPAALGVGRYIDYMNDFEWNEEVRVAARPSEKGTDA
jgi:hypothetical protein